MEHVGRIAFVVAAALLVNASAIAQVSSAPPPQLPSGRSGRVSGCFMSARGNSSRRVSAEMTIGIRPLSFGWTLDATGPNTRRDGGNPAQGWRELRGTVLPGSSEALLLKPYTRVPVPARSLAFSDIARIDRWREGMKPGYKVLLGVGVGARRGASWTHGVSGKSRLTHSCRKAEERKPRCEAPTAERLMTEDGIRLSKAKDGAGGGNRTHTGVKPTGF